MTFFPVETKTSALCGCAAASARHSTVSGGEKERKKKTGMADFIRSTVNWNQSQNILKTGLFSNCCRTQT